MTTPVADKNVDRAIFNSKQYTTSQPHEIALTISNNRGPLTKSGRSVRYFTNTRGMDEEGFKKVTIAGLVWSGDNNMAEGHETTILRRGSWSTANTGPLPIRYNDYVGIRLENPTDPRTANRDPPFPPKIWGEGRRTNEQKQHPITYTLKTHREIEQARASGLLLGRCSSNVAGSGEFMDIDIGV